MKHKTPLIVVGFVCGALAIPALGSQTTNNQLGSTATSQTKLIQVAYDRHHRYRYRHHRHRVCVPIRYKRCYWRYSRYHGRKYYRCYYYKRWSCYYRYRRW